MMKGPLPFLRVAQADVDRFWPHAAALLTPAIRRTGGQFTLEGVRRSIAAGKMQLWLTGSTDSPLAAAVTAILDYPEARVLSVPLLGGTQHRRWIDSLQEVLAEYGQNARCVALEAYVRPGFIGAHYREDRAILKNVEKHWTLIRRPLPAPKPDTGIADRPATAAPDVDVNGMVRVAHSSPMDKNTRQDEL